MLSVENLWVRYGHVDAVQGVSIEVGEGEVVSIVGPNGAGKTSVLSAIGGLVKAREGTIAFQGDAIRGKAPEAIARRGMALVPEGRHIFTTLTVEENLLLGGTCRPAKELEADAAELRERFPILEELRHEPAGNLSGGQQQQLAIARALLARPKLLMLDEPSLGLAPLVVDQVFEILAELREQGVTILLVEQNAMRAIALADRAYVLRQGRIVSTSTRESPIATSDLVQAVLGA